MRRPQNEILEMHFNESTEHSKSVCLLSDWCIEYKNKNHLTGLDMSEKIWILCQGGLWTERRTFSVLNVSFQDLGDSRKTLKSIVSFAPRGNLGILNLTIANRNHNCTQIHLLITRPMVFSPTKSILMIYWWKSSCFYFQPRLQVMRKFHEKTVKSRI